MRGEKRIGGGGGIWGKWNGELGLRKLKIVVTRDSGRWGPALEGMKTGRPQPPSVNHVFSELTEIWSLGERCFLRTENARWAVMAASSVAGLPFAGMQSI